MSKILLVILKRYIIAYAIVALTIAVRICVEDYSYVAFAFLVPVYTAHYVLIAFYFGSWIENKILSDYWHLIGISIIFTVYPWVFGYFYSIFFLLPEVLIVGGTYALIIKFWVKTKTPKKI